MPKYSAFVIFLNSCQFPAPLCVTHTVAITSAAMREPPPGLSLGRYQENDGAVETKTTTMPEVIVTGIGAGGGVGVGGWGWRENSV